MISFRYHLVSIIGIFLAIALGVVIGTSALNGAVVGDLRRQVSDLKKSNSQATDQNTTLQAQAGNADLIAQAFGSKITAGTLAKTSVVIVGAPGASAAAKDAVAKAVTTAGGTVASRYQLSSTFDDPAHANDIRSLATSTSGAHPNGLQLPATDDAGLLAGALLGYVLLGHGQPTDLLQVLTSFSTLGMLNREGTAAAAGKALVVVAPGTLAKNDAATMLLSFVTEAGTIGGPTVVVGDRAAATGAGLVAQVRGSDPAKKALSSVDDATGPLGEVTVALTIADAVAGRKGNYGTAAGADTLLPGVDS